MFRIISYRVKIKSSLSPKIWFFFLGLMLMIQGAFNDNPDSFKSKTEYAVKQLNFYRFDKNILWSIILVNKNPLKIKINDLFGAFFRW